MKVLEQITDKFFSNVRVGKVKVAQLVKNLPAVQETWV